MKISKNNFLLDGADVEWWGKNVALNVCTTTAISLYLTNYLPPFARDLQRKGIEENTVYTLFGRIRLGIIYELGLVSITGLFR